MGAYDNTCIPFYAPGKKVTCQASAAVTGKRMVKISGNRQSGPALNTATDGGNYLAAPATAAAKAFGVAEYDAAIGEKFGVVRGGIVPVTAGATITAGQEVEVGTAGKVIPLASGLAVGMACTGAAADADAEIALY